LRADAGQLGVPGDPRGVARGEREVGGRLHFKIWAENAKHRSIKLKLS
jgi:hypothetical protein